MVESLGNKLGWVMLAHKLHLITAKRVVVLAVRHRAALEPTVEDVGYPLELDAIFMQLDVVDIWTVEVELEVVVVREWGEW